MPRLHELDRDQLSARQRETYDRIAGGPREAVRGPLAAWILAPEFADRAEALGLYCRFRNSLEPRVNELAILMAVRHWRATYAWNGHLAAARSAGLSDEVIEAIRRGEVPAFAAAADAVALKFVGRLLERRAIDEDDWASALAAFGEGGTIDLIGVVGYYGMVAMTILACGIGSELSDPFAGA